MVLSTRLEHLFGAIFARDNLDWQSRELASVGALDAVPGVESQLQSHIGISMNVGLTATQLRQAGEVLAPPCDCPRPPTEIAPRIPAEPELSPPQHGRFDRQASAAPSVGS